MINLKNYRLYILTSVAYLGSFLFGNVSPLLDPHYCLDGHSVVA